VFGFGSCVARFRILLCCHIGSCRQLAFRCTLSCWKHQCFGSDRIRVHVLDSTGTSSSPALAIVAQRHIQQNLLCCCHLWSLSAICGHLLSLSAICCHLLSLSAICYHLWSLSAICCQLLSLSAICAILSSSLPLAFVCHPLRLVVEQFDTLISPYKRFRINNHSLTSAASVHVLKAAGQTQSKRGKANVKARENLKDLSHRKAQPVVIQPFCHDVYTNQQ
jgi:hypothetical protein